MTKKKQERFSAENRDYFFCFNNTTHRFKVLNVNDAGMSQRPCLIFVAQERPLVFDISRPTTRSTEIAYRGKDVHHPVSAILIRFKPE